MTQMRLFLSLVLIAAVLAGCKGKDLGGKDRSTPQKAVAALMLALDARDAEAVRESFASDADQAYVKALVDQIIAFDELTKAVMAKYDKEASDQLLGKGSSRDEHEPYVLADRQACLNAPVKEKDGHAELTLPNGLVMVVKKQGAQWKVVSDGQPQPAAATSMLQSLAANYRTLAERVRQGKLGVEKDVAAKTIREELAKLNQPVFAPPAATTKPASTRPAE